jgi:hypothetical protein
LSEVRVAICVPTHDIIPSRFAYSLGLAMGHMGKNHPYVSVSLLMNHGTLLSEQRTNVAKAAMLDKADWTIWLDSDMSFPMDTIERLLSHQVPIVGCNYSTRQQRDTRPTAFKDYKGNVRVYTEENSTGLEKVAALGFGCIAVHKEVYEAMEPPWFHLPWDYEKMKLTCGEDVYFCLKAQAAGFDVMLDHDLSKEIAHVGVAEYTYKGTLLSRDKPETSAIIVK